MGLFKSIKDLGELQKMASEMPRPSMSETISMARDTVADVQNQQQLMASGTPGTARLLAVADTGATLNNHPICELQLEVTPAGGEPYQAVVRQPVPRLQIATLTPGSTMQVRIDPANPQNVVTDWQAQASALTTTATAAAQGAVAQAGAGQDPVERLERLQALREKGLLTDAEFEGQKARILGEI